MKPSSNLLVLNVLMLVKPYHILSLSGNADTASKRLPANVLTERI